MAEKQQRSQHRDIQGHNPLGFQEGLHHQDRQRIRDGVQQALVGLQQQKRSRREEQEQQQYVEIAGVPENLGTCEPDHEIEQNHDGGRYHYVSEHYQHGRPEVSDIRLELLLVGIQHLLDLGGDYLAFGDYELAGGDIARSGRKAAARLFVDEFSGLLVVLQIGHYEVIDPVLAQQGVHVDVRKSAQIREQLVPGVGKAVDFSSGVFHRPLVALHIYHLRLGHVAAVAPVVHDSPGVDGADFGNHRVTQAPELKPLYRANDPCARLLRILVIRNHRSGGVVPLLPYLLVGLVDGEIELREEGLILPLPPLSVVVGELGVLRHQKDEDQKYDCQRYEPGDELSFHVWII